MLEGPVNPMSAAKKLGVFAYEQNFPGGEGFVYEVQAVLEAIDAGKQECEDYTWRESIAVCKMLDHGRKSIGVVYSQDKTS